jgi:hypothetical protein
LEGGQIQKLSFTEPASLGIACLSNQITSVPVQIVTAKSIAASSAASISRHRWTIAVGWRLHFLYLPLVPDDEGSARHHGPLHHFLGELFNCGIGQLRERLVICFFMIVLILLPSAF